MALLLLHRREIGKPKAWRNSEGDVLYVVKESGFGIGSIAHLIKGAGPRQLPICATSNYLHPDGDDRLFDVQVNVVRDMYRSMQVKTCQWLVRFVTDRAEDDLQRTAATMLAAGITR